MKITIDITDPQAAALREFCWVINETGKVPALVNMHALAAFDVIVAALPRPVEVGDKVRFSGWVNVGEVFALGRNPITGQEFALVASKFTGTSGTTHSVLVSSLTRVGEP